MSKKDKKIDIKTVKSVNKNVRSSIRKLKPILKLVKPVDQDGLVEDLTQEV